MTTGDENFLTEPVNLNPLSGILIIRMGLQKGCLLTEQWLIGNGQYVMCKRITNCILPVGN